MNWLKTACISEYKEAKAVLYYLSIQLAWVVFYLTEKYVIIALILTEYKVKRKW